MPWVLLTSSVCVYAAYHIALSTVLVCCSASSLSRCVLLGYGICPPAGSRSAPFCHTDEYCGATLSPCSTLSPLREFSPRPLLCIHAAQYVSTPHRITSPCHVLVRVMTPRCFTVLSHTHFCYGATAIHGVLYVPAVQYRLSLPSFTAAPSVPSCGYHLQCYGDRPLCALAGTTALVRHRSISRRRSTRRCYYPAGLSRCCTEPRACRMAGPCSTARAAPDDRSARTAFRRNDVRLPGVSLRRVYTALSLCRRTLRQSILLGNGTCPRLGTSLSRLFSALYPRCDEGSRHHTVLRSPSATAHPGCTVCAYGAPHHRAAPRAYSHVLLL
jgi:hypothetical protein